MGRREFSDALKRARRAKGLRDGEDLRPADIARAMGITRAAYGHWESGRSLPKDLHTLERLAGYLGVPVAQFGIDLRGLPLTRPDPQTGLTRVTRRDATKRKKGGA